MSQVHSQILSEQRSIPSRHLGRDVSISILRPVTWQEGRSYPLVLFNDGQDFPDLGMGECVSEMLAEGLMEEVVIAGIHADENRIWEYGVAVEPDYAGRGSRAGETTRFVVEELLPFLTQNYSVTGSGNVCAGFSLGGLMALDIAWNNPGIFAWAGVFSGALWWRKRALTDNYDPSDRIMHAQIRESPTKPDLQFWFECGTWDEFDDRDDDGIIDSIQDTLECIGELERKGYRWGTDIQYREVHEGRHNQETWSRELPVFFKWVSEKLRLRKL